MAEHEFTLLIDGDLSDEQTAARLFDAGCDDATFGTHGGTAYGEFVRDAANFADAVLSAIDQVEHRARLTVTRVEPDDIVTMTDIADRLERSRESVRLLIEGRRGPGGFPPPLTHARERTRLWRWSDVAEWLEQLNDKDRESARFVAALNAALELRRHLPTLTDGLAAKHIIGLVGH